MNNLVVVQIINSLVAGGAEHIAKDIALNLPAGNKCEFITFKKEISSFVKKKLSEKKIKINQVFSPSFFGKQLATYRILQKIKPDIIHTHLGGLSYAFLPAKMLGIPIVHTIHSPLEGKNSLKVRYFHWLAFRLGATPVAVSSEVNRSAKKIFKLRRLTTIESGIDISGFTPPKEKIKGKKKNNLPIDKIILLNVGNLKPVKNQGLLFDAISLLKRNDLFLLIVGKGKFKKQLKKYARELGVKNFRIVTNCDDVKKYLYASDIFILPSKSEGLPLSLLEAMAAKIPIIATRVGEMKRILDDHNNALVIKNNEAKALASAISELSGNAVLRKKIATNARKLVENKFTLSNMVRLYYALYLKKINENSSIQN